MFDNLILINVNKIGNVVHEARKCIMYKWMTVAQRYFAHYTFIISSFTTSSPHLYTIHHYNPLCRVSSHVDRAVLISPPTTFSHYCPNHARAHTYLVLSLWKPHITFNKTKKKRTYHIRCWAYRNKHTCARVHSYGACQRVIVLRKRRFILFYSHWRRVHKARDINAHMMHTCMAVTHMVHMVGYVCVCVCV